MAHQNERSKSSAHVTDDERIELSNEDFLKAIFGGDYFRAHVCAFAEDPGTLDGQDKNHLWAGGPYREKRRRLKPGNNTFFAVSTFSADPEGRQRRRKHLHEATYCVVIDDVREKVDPAKLDGLLPSWRLSTSAGSEQWGYKLTTPETNRGRVEALLNGLVAAGITEDGKDPGMKGVTRYVRLPVGSNMKAKRYVNGEPFRHVLRAWHPERTYTLEDLAAPFDIDLDAVTETGATFTPADWAGDPIPGALAAMGLLKSKLGAGRYDITCPWVGEHTGGADSGSAVLTGPGGQLVYRCHHGHCHDRRWPDFQGHVMDELDRARDDTGDEVLEKPLAELLRRVALAAGWADLGRLDPFEGAEGWEPGEVRSHAAELAELKRTEPGRFNELREHWDRSETYSGKALDKLVQRKRIYCVDFADIEIGDEPPALVENWLEQAGRSVVYGSSNVGKSFFVLDLALHVALGREWRGNQVERGAVVYVAAESGGSMAKRVVAFREHHGIGRQSIPFALVPCSVNLLDEKSDTEALVELILEAGARLGAEPALVVIDTLARAMAGGDENSGKDMSALVDSIDRIKGATRAHVMVVHHTGKDRAKGARGHSALKAAIDTEIEIANWEAECHKQRDMVGGRKLPFQLDTIEVGFNTRGAPITSCVVVEPHIRPGEVIFEDDPRFKGLTGKFLEAAVALRFRWESEQPGRITFDTFKEWMVAAGVRKREEPRQQFHKLKDRLRRAKIIAWTDPHIRYLSGESGN
ncbi:MAG: helicase RepA family protein [Gammaproteobacteria bacterium]|nr:helicase RepA family protein [Gammaproteobacteria bacterium]